MPGLLFVCTRWPPVPLWPGAVCGGRAEHVCSAPEVRRQLVLLCEGVVDLDAEISNGALDLGMPQKKLYHQQRKKHILRFGPFNVMRMYLLGGLRPSGCLSITRPCSIACCYPPMAR